MPRTLRTGERRRARDGGFTLVELLVVMAILAAMVVVAMPHVAALAGPKLEAEARMLGDLLRDARARAMRENREIVVAIDSSAGTVSEPGGPSLMQFTPGMEIGLVAAETERLDHGTGAVRFLPDGSSTGAALTLVRKDRRITLKVDWFDGSVEIQGAGRF